MPLKTGLGSSTKSYPTAHMRDCDFRETGRTQGGFLAWVGSLFRGAAPVKPSPTPEVVPTVPRKDIARPIEGLARFSFSEMDINGLAAPFVEKGDVIAVDFAIEGEGGSRLWDEVVKDPDRFRDRLAFELDEELGESWTNYVTVYKGSTHVNVVLFNDGEQPEKSIWVRVWNAIKRAISALVSFAKVLWPYMRAVGCYIKRAAASVVASKHTIDELARIFGFRDGVSGARTVILWVLNIWRGPGYA